MADLVRIVNRASGVAARVPADVAAKLGREWEGAGRSSVPSPVPDAARAEPESAEGAPSARASRGDWAAYAESLGIEPGDMTKAELQGAVAAL